MPEEEKRARVTDEECRVCGPPALPNSSDSVQTEVSGVTSRALSLSQAIS
jgi:hypothetical protein